MPLFKTIRTNSGATLYVWEITESFEDLSAIYLNENSRVRVLKMKSALHQKGFLSIRYLLKIAGYTDDELYYDVKGKPHLKDGKHISITHSFTFSAIIIGDHEVGIDIEKNRNKIQLIADKFIDSENEFLIDEHIVTQLTVIWGAKESLYKIYPHEGLSFKKHIFVSPFSILEGHTTARINTYDWNKKYHIFFDQLDGFTLVYAYPIE